ncbi:MAG: TIGR03905 family TSCPD domain-containing protein [Oscillospiraceae bacterium]|nr:TIGR03905 family TSCPD domain-containing protein [Oscillospiraceae bacterium]
MKYEYTPRGVCAQKIEFDINDGILHDVKIFGGCQGNGAGIARLVEGMKTDDVIQRLESIRCGARATSCPAQLAAALKQLTDS